MKTKLLLTLFILCFFTAIKSQTPTWQWAKGAGAIDKYKCSDAGMAIVTDSYGNSYITGFFNNVATFGNYTLISNGANDIFVAKYDKNGNCIWVRKAGSNNSINCTTDDKGTGIGIDKNGNVYITGTFSGTALFGSLILVSGQKTSFIAKYDNNGNEIWAIKPTGILYSEDIAVDSYGNSYLTGYSIAAKYNSAGNLIYKTHLGSGADLYDVAVDKFGNAYVTGFLQDSTSIGTQKYISIGKRDALLIKIDSLGNLIWLKNYGTPGSGWNTPMAKGEGISVDDIGNIYFTGSFGVSGMGVSAINFGTITLITPTSNLGNDGVFIVKSDTNGNVLWAKQNLSGNAALTSIINDKFSNVYIAGGAYGILSFHNSQNYNCSTCAFIVKYDSLGNYIFCNVSGKYAGTAVDISVDSLCGIYVVGTFLATSGGSFGNYIPTPYGGSDIYIAKSNGGNGNGCNSPDGIFNFAENKSGFIIYPNPANNAIFLNFTSKIENANLIIYNLLGELQTSKTVNSENSNIDISSLASGVYVVEIKSENKISRQKFIKE